MDITFLIRSLGAGGAERQVSVLARALAGRGVGVRVLTFYPGGEIADELAAAGVPLTSLDKAARWDLAGFGRRLAAVLAARPPDVLMSVLPVANIVSLVARWAAPEARLVWGIRAGFMDLGRYDRLTRWSYALEGRLARLADHAIANAPAARDHAIARGYPADRITVIPNGIEVDRFQPDAKSGAALRRQWGGDGRPLVGLVARLDPIKDHDTFLGALAACPGVRGVCVGDGPEAARLHTLAGELGVAERLVWAGNHRDMTAVYNALDMVCLSSRGEGFPNVLAEAMACGVPCASTDVGAAATLLAGLGPVVPVGNAAALARAITATLDRPPAAAALRARIVERYGPAALVEATMTVLSALPPRRTPAPHPRET